jgi:uncharacterized protein YggE
VQKPADEFYLKVGVVTAKDSAQKALAENSKTMDGLIGALMTVGLEEGEYQTGRFTIHPTYTPYPKDPPANWKASINGYEVTNSLVIQSKKMDLIGAIIDAAARSGASSIDDVRFVVGDMEEFAVEALEKATKRALSNAQAMAKGAHVTLGRLVSISLEPANDDTPYRPMNFAKAVDGESLPPIVPGKATVSATVHAVFEIVEQ